MHFLSFHVTVLLEHFDLNFLQNARQNDYAQIYSGIITAGAKLLYSLSTTWQ